MRGCFFVWGPYLVVNKVYSWLCTQLSPQAGLEGSYEMEGIQPRLANFPAVPSLQPLPGFFFSSVEATPEDA